MKNSKMKLMVREILLLKFCGFIYFLYGTLELIRGRGFPGGLIDGIFNCGIYLFATILFYFGLFWWTSARDYSTAIWCIGPFITGLGIVVELLVFKFIQKEVSLKLIILISIVFLIEAIWKEK